MTSRGRTPWLSYSMFLALSAVAFYYMRIWPEYYDCGKKILETTETGVFHDSPNVQLRRVYTGISNIDYGLSFLVAAFLPGTAGFDQESKLEQAHFLISFYSLVVVFAVESLRSRNRGALITYTWVWALFYQTVGGAIIVPLYYLAFLVTTSRKGYYDSSRSIDLSHATSLLPATAVGYLLPSIALYFRYDDIQTLQAVVALWQVGPLLVDILIFALGNVIHVDKKPKDASESADVGQLKQVYILSFISSFAIHFRTIYVYLNSADLQLSFTRMFLFPRMEKSLTMTELLHIIFKIDEWIILGGAMILCVLVIVQLSQAGRANISRLQALILISIGFVVLGPGAVISATWYWRESKMAQKALGKAE